VNPVFVYSLVTLGVIAFTLGAVLAYASQRFAVAVDPRVEQLNDILPGANCGGCGYAGCAAYSEALVHTDADITLCAPGGATVQKLISNILGKDAGASVRKIAYLHCAGSREKAKDKYIYSGLKDCSAAAMLGGGHKACSYGCLGFGNCSDACNFDALHMGADGLPVVDPIKCTGCGACVRACPKDLFTLQSDETSIYLACSSHDKGKDVKSACSVGCIGCGICAKVTEGDTIVMEDSLPIVDYDAGTNLIIAHYKCPTNSYIDRAKKRPYMTIDPAKCAGQHKCAEVCPVKKCITGEPGEKHTIDSQACIGCGLCFDVCPEKAVRVVGALGYVGMDLSS
jgi:Na+-translocating ferredoxin:NAD+ oxidoreductase subunit B